MKIRVIKNFRADLGHGLRNYAPAGCENGKCDNTSSRVIEIDDEFAIKNNLVKRIKKNGVAIILAKPKNRR
jgi:hypothetical protein